MSEGEIDMVNGWHLDKRVSVGHIVTTLAVAASLAVWMASVEGKTEANAKAITTVNERVERVEDRAQDALIRIETKLDRVIDALAKKADR